MKAKTSLTIASINKFQESAKHRQKYFCKHIRGFHIMATKKGYSWRLRYHFGGKERVVTLGDKSTHISTAADLAVEYNDTIRRGIDPLLEKEKAKLLATQERHDNAVRKLNTVGKFFNDVYTPHIENARSGKDTLALIKFNFAHLFDRQLDSLTGQDVRQWEMARRKKGIKQETLIRNLSAFKAMLNYAAGVKKNEPIDHPVIQTNPLAEVNITRLSANERDSRLLSGKSDRRMLTDSELRSLHNGLHEYSESLKSKRRNSRAHGNKTVPCLDSVAFPHWIIPFTLVALNTGFRVGDIYGLRWEAASANNVNLNFKRIVIVPEKTRDKGDNPVQVNQPLTDELLEVLSEWHKQKGHPKSGYVFPNGTGERIAKKSHETHWSHIRRLGGLPDNLAFYSLRHHFVSALVLAGVPLLHIAKLTGHKSTSMIEEHYGHLLPNVAEDVMRQYSKTVSGKRQLLNKEQAHV